MEVETYSKRTWLNPEDSNYSGSIVAFHGMNHWLTREGAHRKNLISFIEIADCRQKISLHKANENKGKDMEQFITKIKLLESEIHNFVCFLQKTYPKE